MKPPKPRLLSSTRCSVLLNWSHQPILSSSGSSSSLLQRNRQSRSSLSSDDRKVSRTSLSSMDTSQARKSLRTPKESLEDLLDSPVAETFCQNKEWFTLQSKHRMLGWKTVYWGYKNQTDIFSLAPGEVYQFRVKSTTDEEDSEWSDVLTAATKDDVISAACLHRALDQGHMTSARKVLALRISALEIPNKLGRAPLAVAAVKGDTNICNMLLTCGADVTAQETGSHRTPLMIAAYRGGTELINVLKEKDASWLAKDRFGQTALHYITLNSQVPAVQLAVKECPDIDVKDDFGWTPLMLAVTASASIEVLECLLTNGADVNSSDKRGQTILMQAVITGSPETVKLLIKYGANIEMENCNEHTAYDMAKQSSNPDMVQLLQPLESKKKTVIDHIRKTRKQSQPAIVS